MHENSISYKHILKNSSIIAAASAINIGIGLVRTKVLALLLGPVGVGTVGLYSNLMITAATIFSFGLGTSGAQNIAAANGSGCPRSLSLAKYSVKSLTLLLAFISTLVIWLLSDYLAIFALGKPDQSNTVALLSVGVGFSVVVTSQGAILQGIRDITSIAKVSIYSSMLNTIVGLLVIWLLGSAGLVWFILVGPLSSFIFGSWYISRESKSNTNFIPISEISPKWISLVKIGIPFMGASLAGSLVQLWIRISLGNSLGLDAIGHYQAAWVISSQYIGFILGAMGADYFPRLTNTISDHRQSSLLVNQQTEIVLLLSGPIFIAMIGMSSWIVPILYSQEFFASIEVLRWQILGDVLKVLSWPMSFVLLAKAKGKLFFISESIALVIMGACISIGASYFGLRISGIAYLLCYAVYLPMMYVIVRTLIAFRWSRRVILHALTVFISAILVHMVCTKYSWGASASLLLASIFLVHSVVRLAHLSDQGGLLGRVVILSKSIYSRLTTFSK